MGDRFNLRGFSEMGEIPLTWSIEGEDTQGEHGGEEVEEDLNAVDCSNTSGQ